MNAAVEQMKPRDVRSVLLVEDDELFRVRLMRALVARGYDVRAAADAAEARRMATEESPEFAVVDLRLPDASGLDVVRALHLVDPATAIVVLTGYGSIATAIEAVRIGATYYVQKPADADDVLAAFERGASPPLEGAATDYTPPTLARAEWEHINRVMSDCGGNVSEAARRLGIHRRSLQRKLQKYPPRE